MERGHPNGPQVLYQLGRRCVGYDKDLASNVWLYAGMFMTTFIQVQFHSQLRTCSVPINVHCKMKPGNEVNIGRVKTSRHSPQAGTYCSHGTLTADHFFYFSVAFAHVFRPESIQIAWNDVAEAARC